MLKDKRIDCFQLSKRQRMSNLKSNLPPSFSLLQLWSQAAPSAWCSPSSSSSSSSTAWRRRTRAATIWGRSPSTRKLPPQRSTHRPWPPPPPDTHPQTHTPHSLNPQNPNQCLIIIIIPPPPPHFSSAEWHSITNQERSPDNTIDRLTPPTWCMRILLVLS